MELRVAESSEGPADLLLLTVFLLLEVVAALRVQEPAVLEAVLEVEPLAVREVTESTKIFLFQPVRQNYLR